MSLVQEIRVHRVERIEPAVAQLGGVDAAAAEFIEKVRRRLAEEAAAAAAARARERR